MKSHDHETQSVRKASGAVTEVFAHRFVLKTPDGTVLADLTPHGAADMVLTVGDEIDIEGEQKPSEIKVAKVTRDGRTVVIGRKGPKPGSHLDRPDVDPAPAIAAAEAAGYRVVGEPRRKPKHVEILGESGQHFHELHVGFDGRIRTSRPVAADDGKWMSDISAAARS